MKSVLSDSGPGRCRTRNKRPDNIASAAFKEFVVSISGQRRQFLERISAARNDRRLRGTAAKYSNIASAEVQKSGPMRVIALIEETAVVRAILTHLGRWQPKALERAPPMPPEAWPAHASLLLTYHSVTDIA